MRRRFDTATVIVAVPFLAFVGLFLFLPVIGLAIKAFTPGGSFGFSAM